MVEKKRYADETAFQFNDQIEKKVRSIISPLNEIVPLSSFCFVRFYDDGRLLHIQPDKLSLENLLDMNFHDQGLKNDGLKDAISQTVVSSQYIWPQKNQDELARFFSQFGIKNQASIIAKHDSYFDALNLSNSLDDTAGQEMNISNSELYKHFYAYFIEKMNDIIDYSEKDIYFP